jgi:hypothetical protein
MDINDTIYGYSFILTNTDASTPDKAVAVEYWYRHRTSIENLFRDSKHGAALRHLPSGGYVEVNAAWLWGALLAASMAAWLHQLTATEHPTTRNPDARTRPNPPCPQPENTHPKINTENRRSTHQTTRGFGSEIESSGFAVSSC